MALFDRIKDIIVDQLSVDPDDVHPEASFIEDLGGCLPPTETVETLKTASHEWQWSRVAIQGGVAVIRFNCDKEGLPTDQDTLKKVH